jgi:FixJ family two-component response regulator
MIKVAIVDDDLSVRTGLERLFRVSGYEVSLFASAEEFLLHLPEDRPDCLILDRKMGGMSGDDLLLELSAQGIVLPTVVISGLVHDESPHQANKRPPPVKSWVRLSKPFSAAAILEAVQAVMDGEHTLPT